MRRVVKIGGSLLVPDDLVRRLPQRLHEMSAHEGKPTETLLIVGGGELVDAVRRLDQIHPSDPETIHWACVDLMQSTMEIVQGWFSDWKMLSAPEELWQSKVNGFSSDFPTFVSPKSFYRRCSKSVLPMDWRTTSDSIAALLAVEVRADELVLFKSCNVDLATNIKELAARGIVDEAMPLIAERVQKIRVREF